MRCLIGTRLFLVVSAPLLKLVRSARIVPTAILAWIWLPLRLWLIVGWVRVPQRPLVGRCKISRVRVPVAIAVPHRSTLIGPHIGSHVRPISWSIIVLTVWTVVGIP